VHQAIEKEDRFKLHVACQEQCSDVLFLR